MIFVISVLFFERGYSRVSSIGEAGLSASRRCSPSNAGPIEQKQGCEVSKMYAAVKKRQSPFPLQPLPLCGGGADIPCPNYRCDRVFRRPGDLNRHAPYCRFRV